MSDDFPDEDFPGIVDPANEGTCDDCGDPAEYVVKDETQIELHALCDPCYDARKADHPDQIRILKTLTGSMYHCRECGNRWRYGGSADRPTCSNANCRSKKTGPITSSQN